MADLRGKRIAAEVGALDMVHLVLALQAAGMGMEDVKLVPMSQAALPAAWQAGKIDAAVTYPCSVALLDAGAQRVFDTSQIPGAIIDVMMAEPDFISQNTEKCTAILRAITQAVAYYRQNPEAALAIMARRGGVTPAILAGDLQGLSIPDGSQQVQLMMDGAVLLKSIEATIQAWVPESLSQGQWFTSAVLTTVPDALSPRKEYG